jgi:hypothetical protein
MIGWSPHRSQPKPLQRGSPAIKLNEIDNLSNIQEKKKTIEEGKENNSTKKTEK